MGLFENAELFCKAVTEDIQSLEKKIADLQARLDVLQPRPVLELRRKLTLPVNKDGGFTGEAMEIPYAALKAGYSSEFYKPSPDGFLDLYVPAKGATTDNAKYPRTEERWYLADPSAPVRPDGFDTMINMERGGYVWNRLAMIHLYAFQTGGKVVVRQSHAVEAPPDWKVIVTAAGQIYILCKLTDASTEDDGRIDLATGGNVVRRTGGGLEPFKLFTEFDGNTLKASLNGGSVQSIKFNKKSMWYPKGDGLYNAAATSIRATVQQL